MINPMRQQIVALCIEKVTKLPQRPCFVAITGESGSGKSYFSKALRRELVTMNIAYTLISDGDFLIPRRKRDKLRQQNVYFRRICG